MCSDSDRDWETKAKNDKLEKVYKRDDVMNRFWDGEKVTTIFNRKMKASLHHALNYIIQSTTSDLFLRRMVAINEKLKNYKSFVAFSIHDSLVIDLDQEEKHILPELIEIFENTDLGTFKANVSAGKNFAEMRKIQ